jgi:hypothetical protein
MGVSRTVGLDRAMMAGMTWRSRLVRVSLCALSTGVVMTAPAEAAPTASPAATQVRSIAPVEANGQLAATYTVKHQYAGANCVSGSPTTGTSYECFSSRSSQGVFDSCWVQANPHYASCLDHPWSHDVIRLHVTGGYDNRSGFARVTAPWGLRLGASTRCLVDLGGIRTVDGHARTYTCNHHVVLTGTVRRTASAWRIRAYRRVKHKHAASTYTSLGLTAVSVSWKGRPSRTG